MHFRLVNGLFGSYRQARVRVEQAAVVAVAQAEYATATAAEASSESQLTEFRDRILAAGLSGLTVAETYELIRTLGTATPTFRFVETSRAPLKLVATTRGGGRGGGVKRRKKRGNPCLGVIYFPTRCACEV